MNIARIVGGIVVNLEIADEEWISENSTEEISFVSTEGEIDAHIGSTWTPELGFQKSEERVALEQPDFIPVDEDLDLEIEEALAGE